MPRWALVLLLTVGVLSAGVGTALTLQAAPRGAAGFGWTAYSPLSGTSYSPGDLSGLFWSPELAAVLLAFGAGITGAISTALVLTRDGGSGPRR